MDKVECSRLIGWGWSCPECGEWNEVLEERGSVVQCEGCNEEFEATFEP